MILICVEESATSEVDSLLVDLFNADLVAEPISTNPPARGLSEVAQDVALAFAVQGSYDAIRSLVERWMERRHVRRSDVTVTDEDEIPPSDDPQH